MDNTLSDRRCIPCKKGTPPLSGEDISKLLDKLEAGWILEGGHHLAREFQFKNFKEALQFTNRIGEIAETERHHPDIHLSWGKVRVTIWTHSIDGLSENDFILAAKIDRFSEP